VSDRRMSEALLEDVVAELRAHPRASANDVDRRLREAGKGYWRNDVLRAVRVLRMLPTTPTSGRGPGRPKKSVPVREAGS
jgi:hypothetical protein